jgi:hypothetical protein
MFDAAKIKKLYEKRYSGLYRAWCENNIKQMNGVTKNGWVDHKEAIASVKQQTKGLKIKL